MPNRIIKESINESRTLSDVSFFAEDLYKRLITYADDYGRFNADYQIILARLYPREIGIVSAEDIDDAMTELIGAGKIKFFTSPARNELYGCFPNWKEHQRIRESKKKIPDPCDTTINDWYLKRFIPKHLKKEIIERDGFKCKLCGNYICSSPISADRLLKMGAGLFHIDHIVPVDQGGRATIENLRLLCPKCNLSRKKKLPFDEILEITRKQNNSPQLAASFSGTPQKAALIQSESNPNPKPIRIQAESAREAKPAASEEDDGFTAFWDAYPRKTGYIDRAYFEYRNALQSGATKEQLLAAITWQAEEWAKTQEARYMQSAENWLKNRGWTAKKGVGVAPKPSSVQASGKEKRSAEEISALVAGLDKI